MHRRHFLSRCSAGTISLALPALARADATPWPNFSFLVVTDTHLGYRTAGNASAQWEKTAAELAAADGSIVLHLGDVVDRGQSELYPEYLEVRAQIKKPVYEIPGNHDEREDFEKHLSVASDRTLDIGGIKFILFSNSRRTSHDGFVSRDQLAWISDKCRAAAETGKRIIFCSHVPFHHNLPPDRGWHVKPENGQRAFYEIVEEHKDRIIASFHGHFHSGLRGWSDRAPMHEIVFPSSLYNENRRITKRSAPGYNLDEFRPGYTKVRLKDHSMELEYTVVGKPHSITKKLAYDPA